jgi:hypothetical protein
VRHDITLRDRFTAFYLVISTANGRAGLTYRAKVNCCKGLTVREISCVQGNYLTPRDRRTAQRSPKRSSSQPRTVAAAAALASMIVRAIAATRSPLKAQWLPRAIRASEFLERDLPVPASMSQHDPAQGFVA